MHAATVELLVEKAHLDPDTALAIATAIDMALQNAQLVTVAVLDARFLAFEAKMDARFAAVNRRFSALEAEMEGRFAETKRDAADEKSKAELFRWGFLITLCNVVLTIAAHVVLNALLHLR
jgi:hypothetical protein